MGEVAHGEAPGLEGGADAFVGKAGLQDRAVHLRRRIAAMHDAALSTPSAVTRSTVGLKRRHVGGVDSGCIMRGVQRCGGGGGGVLLRPSLPLLTSPHTLSSVLRSSCSSAAACCCLQLLVSSSLLLLLAAACLRPSSAACCLGGEPCAPRPAGARCRASGRPRPSR